jgi:hypothetical protein
MLQPGSPGGVGTQNTVRGGDGTAVMGAPQEMMLRLTTDTSAFLRQHGAEGARAGVVITGDGTGDFVLEETYRDFESFVRVVQAISNRAETRHFLQAMARYGELQDRSIILIQGE